MGIQRPLVKTKESASGLQCLGFSNTMNNDSITSYNINNLPPLKSVEPQADIPCHSQRLVYSNPCHMKCSHSLPSEFHDFLMFLFWWLCWRQIWFQVRPHTPPKMCHNFQARGLDHQYNAMYHCCIVNVSVVPLNRSQCLSI